MIPGSGAEDPALAWLFHGWVTHVVLFAMLLVALVLFGWCWNRPLRPADRGPLLRGTMLLAGFGLVLLLRHVEGGLWPALIIAIGVTLAGLIGRNDGQHGLWLPVMLFSALLGLGLHLSALVLAGATVLVLLLGAPSRAR